MWRCDPFQISTKIKEVFNFICKLNDFWLFFYLEFKKDEEHLINIKDDVDYFPVIQGQERDAAASLFKPQEQ